jgi:hypothetical protein
MAPLPLDGPLMAEWLAGGVDISGRIGDAAAARFQPPRAGKGPLDDQRLTESVANPQEADMSRSKKKETIKRRRAEKKLASKHRRRKHGTRGPKGFGGDGRVHSDYEVAAMVMAHWGKVKHIPDENARWYTCMIGSLAVAKLTFRVDCQQQGSLRFDGDPEMLRFLEEKANLLADSIVTDVRNSRAQDGWLLNVRGVRLAGEREYLTLVREPNLGFRWRKAEIALDEVVPSEYDIHAAGEAARHVEGFIVDIAEQLGAARHALAHNENLVQSEYISHWIGLMAVAKFVLHMLPTKLGAMLEHFGELESARIYEQVTGHSPTDAVAPSPA